MSRERLSSIQKKTIVLIHEKFDIPKENISIVAVIDLPDLGGSSVIRDNEYNVETLIEFEGE